jgi:hypothetical protein
MTRKADNQIKSLSPRNPQSSSPYAGAQEFKNNINGVAWEGRQASELKLLIAAVTANGHALMFAQTRNGGLSLTVYTDSEPVKFRMYDSEEVDTIIGSVTERALGLLDRAVMDRLCQASAE